MTAANGAGWTARSVALATLIAAGLLLTLPPVDPVSAPAMRAAGLIVLVLGLWGSGIVPEFLVGLVFFLVAMLLQIAPADVIFAGFGATAVWLVFSGLVIAVAVERTGLGGMLAALLVVRVGRSYLGLLSGVALVSLVLAFLLPAFMSRVLLLMPIVLTLAGRLGYGPGSRERTGVVMVMLLVSYVASSALLPSIAPNMVLAGAVETIYGFSLSYAKLFVLMFPVASTLRVLLIVFFCWVCFRDRPPAAAEMEPGAPIGRDGCWLLVLLLAALALWVSDTVHGISPAWVALGVAVILLLPRIGLIPVAAFHEGVSIGPLLVIASVLGIAKLIVVSGLGDLMGQWILGALALEHGNDFWNYLILSATWSLMTLFVTVGGLPAVVTPLAGDIAAATGLPLETVLMTEVIGYSTLLFPYEAGPVMVGLALSGVTNRDAVRVMVPLAILSFVIVVPLNYLWWAYLGYVG